MVSFRVDMPRKGADPRVPLKLPPGVHARLKALSEHVAQYGWASVGVDRKDAVTMGAIVEEAVALLEQRAKKTERS
jgi:hypothetical protein